MASKQVRKPEYAAVGETDATPEELHAMLTLLPASQLQIWPVDKRVGNVKNDGSELAQPVIL